MIDIELTNAPARPPMIDIELADAPAALSVQLQTYAQGYIDARKRAGYAWLDMGRFLIEARREAKHGEWGVFLSATQTSEDQAKRLMAIYTQSLTDRAFADAVRTNLLSVATAYELTSAPPDVQQRLLERDAPITRAQIREEKREAANPAPAPTLDAAPFWQSMSPNHPTAHLWTRKGMNEHHAACGMRTQRAPSGSLDAGHCSSCVRATWPQNQPAPSAINRPDGSPAGTLPIPPDLVGWTWEVSPPDTYQLTNGTHTTNREAHPHHAIVAARNLIADAQLDADLVDVDRALAGIAAAPAATGDHALIAQIRSQADALGLKLIWEDDRVQLYWEEEEDQLDQLDLLSYGAALEWLARDAPAAAERRTSYLAPKAAPDHAASDRIAHLAREETDRVLLAKAEMALANGDTDAAHDLLSQVSDVSASARDQLRSAIPAGRTITLAFTDADCAALLKEARMFSGSELTKRLPAIGQVLVLLVEGIRGATD